MEVDDKAAEPCGLYLPRSKDLEVLPNWVSLILHVSLSAAEAVLVCHPCFLLATRSFEPIKPTSRRIALPSRSYSPTVEEQCSKLSTYFWRWDIYYFIHLFLALLQLTVSTIFVLFSPRSLLTTSTNSSLRSIILRAVLTGHTPRPRAPIEDICRSSFV